jgi:hypothetical protein
MRNTPAGLAEHYALKALFERILGRASFMRVKEYAPLSAWKSESSRFLKALNTAMRTTVLVADKTWRDQVNELIEMGKSRVARAESVSELHAGLAATLGELSFLQLGYVPDNTAASKTIPVNSIYWDMSAHRSVQYVQSDQQREEADKELARRKR